MRVKDETPPAGDLPPTAAFILQAWSLMLRPHPSNENDLEAGGLRGRLG
jgi:hypothetical protein